MKKVILPIVLICSCLIISGCSTTSKREKIHLAAGDTGAIIAIFGNSHMEWDNVPLNENGLRDFNILDVTSKQSGGALTLIANTGLDEKAKLENNMEKMKKRSMTYPFINQVDEISFDVFENGYDYNLIPQDEVINSIAYKNLYETKTARFLADTRMFEKPDEYAYINIQNMNLSDLADEIGADFFVAIQIDVFKSMKAAFTDNLTGFMSPKVFATVFFYDKNGILLASASGEYKNEKSISVLLGQFDVDNFYSLCPETIERAIADALYSIEKH